MKIVSYFTCVYIFSSSIAPLLLMLLLGIIYANMPSACFDYYDGCPTCQSRLFAQAPNHIKTRVAEYLASSMRRK